MTWTELCARLADSEKFERDFEKESRAQVGGGASG